MEIKFVSNVLQLKVKKLNSKTVFKCVNEKNKRAQTDVKAFAKWRLHQRSVSFRDVSFILFLHFN